jgi:hypothetical protein
MIADTIQTDDNEESRLSRTVIGYDLTSGEEGDELDDYKRVLIRIDVDAEEREFFGEDRIKIILSEWIQPNDSPLAEYITFHLINRFKQGARRLIARFELKDEDILLGSFVTIDTDHFQDAHGNSLDSKMHVIKKKTAGRNQLEMEFLDLGLLDLTAFWTPDAHPDWSASTAAEREYGYWTDDEGFIPTGNPGYHWW